MWAATPMEIVPEASSCGPTVSCSQDGLEQTNPTRLPSASITALVNSSRVFIDSHHRTLLRLAREYVDFVESIQAASPIATLDETKGTCSQKPVRFGRGRESCANIVAFLSMPGAGVEPARRLPSRGF